MSREMPEAPRNEAEAEQDAIWAMNRRIRYNVRNLRDAVSELAYLPHRDELVRAFEEVLRLAPPKSEHDDAVSEYVRRTELGEVVPDPEDPGAG
jgi:hypothetical protein